MQVVKSGRTFPKVTYCPGRRNLWSVILSLPGEEAACKAWGVWRWRVLIRMHKYLEWVLETDVRVVRCTTEPELSAVILLKPRYIADQVLCDACT